MSYEESHRRCPECARATWHGREVPDVYRSYWLTVVSHLITVYSDLFIPWTCLECGGKGCEAEMSSRERISTKCVER